MVGIVGLILAVVAVVILIWKNWHMAIVFLIGSLIVILFNMMNPVTVISETFMGGMKDFAGSWFLLFMLGSIFGKIMGDSGASAGIANHLLGILGEKYVVLIIMLTGLVLSYGGIATFVIAFSLYPIAVALFKKADIPKALIVASIMTTPVTVCMTMAPGSPSSQNLVPTTYFGTTFFAGPVIGITCSIIMFIAAYLYLGRQIKKAKLRGEHFVPTEGEVIMDLNSTENRQTLVIWKCYMPIAVLLVIMFGLQKMTKIPSAFIVACAMTAAVIAGLALYKKRLNVYEVMNGGAGNGLGSLISVAAIMGFGSVVSSSPAYEKIVNGLLNMNIGPLGMALISINVIAAITGSSIGGLNIFLASMGEYLAATGLNLSMLHRVVCIASSGFDAMPHSSGIIVCNQVAKTSQKDTYKHVFITCCVMPFCCAVLAAVMGAFGVV